MLIEKHWAVKIKRTACELFWEHVLKAPARHEVPPVIATAKYYLLHVMRGELFFLTVLSKDVRPLFILELQQRIVDVFCEYVKKPNEATIKENFSSIYQLLDEMIDGGFPSTTELNQLKEMIIPTSVARRVLNAISGTFLLLSSAMTRSALRTCALSTRLGAISVRQGAVKQSHSLYI